MTIALCWLLYLSWDLQPYFLSAMLGVGTAFALAIAWGIYLYRDKLLQSNVAEDRKKESPVQPSAELSAGVINDEDEFLRTFQRGLIPRPPEDQSAEPTDWPYLLQFSFLWSAILLLGFTVFIYYAYGIGAYYQW